MKKIPQIFLILTFVYFYANSQVMQEWVARYNGSGRGVFTKLSVFDILGREITTLVNEQLKPGTYEVSWSAAGGATEYPSGVYFYMLQTESFTKTMKMVLLK